MRAPDERINGRWASEIAVALPDRIHQAVERHMKDTPGAEALVDDRVRWTYADLEEAVHEARLWLQERGLRPGDRLMLVSENGRALVTLLLAASQLDVWAAIINARLAPNEIDAIRENCDPRRLIYTVESSPDAAQHAERHRARPLALRGAGELAVSDLSADSVAEPVVTDGTQVAAMIYTSGTTGRPKGVMLSHRGILYIARVSGGLRNLRPGRHVYGVLPSSHVFGLSSVMVGSLANGACLHPVARFDAGELLDALAAENIAVLQGVPAMFARVLEYLHHHGRELRAPALDYLSVGGAPLDADLKRRVEALFGTTLHNGYGLTEASPTISQTRIGDVSEATSVGRVLPGLEYRIVHLESRQKVLRGEVGELRVRGPSVMRGYFRDPQATRAVLDDEGWLNTGDLARLDADDQLHIVGRAKELIIRSGFNVYPPDVEAVLNEHPAVTLSAVVGRQVAGNEEVVAYVQLAPGAALSAADLSEFAARRLSAYKRPSEIRFLEALPATPAGKILKGRLRELANEKAKTGA